jgi:carboxymethylenebutenolidase
MSFKTEWVRFGVEKQHAGFLGWPERAVAPVPGIVVIQEAWGVDAHIEDVTLRFAQAGYVALAPDLFAENGERPAPLSRERLAMLKEFANTAPPAVWGDPKARDEALSQLPEPRRSQVGESFGALFGAAIHKLDTFVPKVVDAAAFLRSEHPLTRGAKIGSVGFCMGGGLSARLACKDPELGAAVMFYGTAPPAESIASITCPVLALYGAVDPRVNAGIADFAAAMSAHGKRLEQHVYEGAGHAFFNDGRPSYHARASRDAFARTLSWFAREL